MITRFVSVWVFTLFHNFIFYINILQIKLHWVNFAYFRTTGLSVILCRTWDAWCPIVLDIFSQYFILLCLILCFLKFCQFIFHVLLISRLFLLQSYQNLFVGIILIIFNSWVKMLYLFLQLLDFGLVSFDNAVSLVFVFLLGHWWWHNKVCFWFCNSRMKAWIHNWCLLDYKLLASLTETFDFQTCLWDRSLTCIRFTCGCSSIITLSSFTCCKSNFQILLFKLLHEGLVLTYHLLRLTCLLLHNLHLLLILLNHRCTTALSVLLL